MAVTGMKMTDSGYSGSGITDESRDLAVKLESADTYAVAGAGEHSEGLIDGYPQNGVVSVVRLGKARGVAGGSIAVGNYVKAGANGVLVDAGAPGSITDFTHVVGKALESAVTGQVFTVWANPTEVSNSEITPLTISGASGTSITDASSNLAVKLESAGTYTVAGAGDHAEGLIDGTPEGGVMSVVKLGKSLGVAGGEITVGNYVKSGADGKLVDAGAPGAIAATTNVVGKALEAASNGDVFSVWVNPAEITKPSA